MIGAFDSTTVSTRGFTGHEMIDSVDLVHMNGRIYDPEIGRFLSADPHVQEVGNLQSMNRYSYVLNNPLSFTDPSGFFFSKLFKSIGNFFSSIFRAVGNVLKQALKNGILRSLITIIGCAATAVGGPAGWAACGAISGAITMAAGGSITDGLKAFAFAFVIAGVWAEVGAVLKPFAGEAGFALLKGAVHGVVGGALSVAQGGSFLQGFASNAIGAVTGLVASGVQDPIVHTLIVAASGCASAALTGGKCGEAALTAAFANLYNYWRSVHRGLTGEAATKSGLNLSYEQSNNLANMVSAVDTENDTHSRASAHVHAMCSLDWASAQCQQKHYDYRSENWERRDLLGLARLLHMQQDSYAPLHKGGAGYGGIMRNGLGLDPYSYWVLHFITDMAPVGNYRSQVINHSAQLIRNYNDYCGGCVRAPINKR
jgi:RHS repeat-associated protein